MLSYADAVAVAEFVVYIPALAGAILLVVKHGISRSSGYGFYLCDRKRYCMSETDCVVRWRFLIIFALARLIQAGMQLGTIASPANKSLYIGIAILLGIAVSPLELLLLGLLSRLVSSINKTKETLITPRHIQLVQLLNTVGLILGIIGGNQAGQNFGKTGVYQQTTLSKVGLALFIISFVAIVLGTGLLALDSGYAEQGERRIVLALALSLPFLLVRIIYSCLSTFGGLHSFSLFGGNETILLVMALLMEFIIVVIVEGVGLTLKKVPKENPAAAGQRLPSRPEQAYPMYGKQSRFDSE